MRSVFRALACASLGTAAFLACSEERSAAPPPVSNDAGPAPFLQDAQATPSDAAAAVSTMRLAHLAPELGPIDYCYRSATAGTSIGPVFSGSTLVDAGADADAALDAEADADADAAPPPELDTDGGSADGFATYRTVTKYSNLEASGPITISIVTAGATSCANPLAQADVTLDPGKLSTVVLFGRRTDGGTSLEVASFTDDRSTTADSARVRVIHAALGRGDTPAAGNLTVLAVGTKTLVLADTVEPRKAATPSDAVDALGYATTIPLPNPVAIAIGEPGVDAGFNADAAPEDGGFAAWESLPSALDLRGGSLHTAFVLSRRSHVEVLWCTDSTTVGNRTACELVR